MKAQDTVIAESIDYLVAHYADQPDLDFLAARAGYEPTHFQKLFREKVGISPKRLIQYMTFKKAQDFVLQGHSNLEAAHRAGLSTPSRLYDLFVNCIAATPGEVAKRGAGLEIRYGFHPCVLGELIVAQTSRGVCWTGFITDKGREYSLSRLRADWPKAELIEDFETTKNAADEILKIWAGAGDKNKKLKLDLYGTNFQIQIWKALLKIPCGSVVSYKDVAMAVGDPKACRAVGSAVGSNPITLLIPCHRVIQSSGIVENYGWGTPRKKFLLGLEGDLSQAEDIAHRIKAG